VQRALFSFFSFLSFFFWDLYGIKCLI
jgi:hypothetical protein